MKIVLVIIAILCTLICYCCCVVAGDADRQTEKMLRKDQFESIAVRND